MEGGGPCGRRLRVDTSLSAFVSSAMLKEYSFSRTQGFNAWEREGIGGSEGRDRAAAACGSTCP